MLRTAGLLALPRRTWSAGFDGRISPPVAALLLGGWDLTETGLTPASRVGLIWTHCLEVLSRCCSALVHRLAGGPGSRYPADWAGEEGDAGPTCGFHPHSGK